MQRALYHGRRTGYLALGDDEPPAGPMPKYAITNVGFSNAAGTGAIAAMMAVRSTLAIGAHGERAPDPA
jgi:hypothetical protein